MSYYIPTKNVSPIRALVRVHEAKVSNSQYLIKEFQEFTGNQNTPRLFCVFRDPKCYTFLESLFTGP